MSAFHSRAATSDLTPNRRAAIPAPRRARAAWLVAALLGWVVTSPAGAAGSAPLPPEQAFAYSIRALDPTTIEARFNIATGYYLYRDRVGFTVAPGALAPPPVLPAGVVKEDQFFGKVETWRSQVAVRLQLAAPAPGSAVTVTAESQGCADIGLCYPPQRQSLTVTMPAPGAGPGAPVEFAPAKKGWFN